MPEISVIIPFKDRVEWLNEAVDSVLAQTFQDFELILVDDGSVEDHSSVYKRRDGRIKYIRQSNQGPSAARNSGIEIARGEYIAFLDSDDLFERTKLEKQIKLMKKANSSFSHTSYRQITGIGELIGLVHSGSFKGNVYPAIYSSCPIATPTVMLKRSLLINECFDQEIKIGEDILLWAKISRTNSIHGIDIPLTSVRLHTGNAAFNNQTQIIGLTNILEYGVNSDTSLGLFKKCLIISNLNLEIARDHLLLNEKRAFLKRSIQGILYAPYNIKIIRLFAILIIPKKIQKKLKLLLGIGVDA